MPGTWAVRMSRLHHDARQEALVNSPDASGASSPPAPHSSYGRTVRAVSRPSVRRRAGEAAGRAVARANTAVVMAGSALLSPKAASMPAAAAGPGGGAMVAGCRRSASAPRRRRTLRCRRRWKAPSAVPAPACPGRVLVDYASALHRARAPAPPMASGPHDPRLEGETSSTHCHAVGAVADGDRCEDLAGCGVDDREGARWPAP